jgi:hypothetical protein
MVLVDVLYIRMLTFAIDVFWLKRLLSTFGVKFMYTGAVFFQSIFFYSHSPLSCWYDFLARKEGGEM